ncbi:MAG: hypothetical protein IT262_10935 [Saprospiraceae bacterium]|nr:hypothetical protein [Saprospiraceae bacterium]
MKFLPTILFALLFVFISSCDKDEPQTEKNFTLTFKSTYGGLALEKYKNYPYDDRDIQVNKFNTFLSDLILVRQDGSEQRLSDIEWVDFTPDLAPDNKAVDVKFQYTVPAGNYTALKIGYGVRPDLNAKKPADFAPEHPLYRENEYWSGWQSYIFTKVQGLYDLDGAGDPESTLTYHCGSDAVYRTSTMNATIPVTDKSGALTVEFDVKKLFYYNGGLLDLDDPLNRNTSHNASNIDLGIKVMDNFANATTVK